MTSMHRLIVRTAAVAALLTLLAVPTSPVTAAPVEDSATGWSVSWSALADEFVRLGEGLRAMFAAAEGDPGSTGEPQFRPTIDPNGLTAAPEPEAPFPGTDAPHGGD